MVGEIIAYAVLFRTQNLAASAGLHWMNNVLALLMPTVPGQPTVLGLAIYTDPVYMAGGSRLFDPLTHAAGAVGVTLLLTMFFWRRSPFYLAPPAPGETTAPAAEPPKTSARRPVWPMPVRDRPPRVAATRGAPMEHAFIESV